MIGWKTTFLGEGDTLELTYFDSNETSKWVSGSKVK